MRVRILILAFSICVPALTRAQSGDSTGTRYQVPRAFLGATVGYDLVVFRRLIIGPALGVEYGRPDPVGDVRTWQLAPRLGFGFNFE